MIQLDFSEADITALDYERYHHPHPHVQRKMEVLYLKSQATGCGFSNSHYGTSLLGFSVFLIFRKFRNPSLARVLEALIFIMRIAVAGFSC